MEITISNDDGIVLRELNIDEVKAEIETGETGEDLACLIAEHIEEKFDTK